MVTKLQDPLPDIEGKILMWSAYVLSKQFHQRKTRLFPHAQSKSRSLKMFFRCQVCTRRGENFRTPAIPMSDDTWAFSFAKYLELTFYNTYVLLPNFLVYTFVNFLFRVRWRRLMFF